MKKAGEKAKAVFMYAVFTLLILLVVTFVIKTASDITGYAVLDATTAKAKLETALSNSALFSQLQQSSICVVIKDPEQPLSLQATKSSAGWTVVETSGYCSGLTTEDVVVQFATYDEFSKIVDDPSPRNIANGAIAQDYQILQSRYVELGGNVVCDAAFKVKYCSALKTMTSAEQLIDGDLTCCIDKLTTAQKELLEQHLQEGNFEDEIGILEKPSGMAVAGMSITMLGGIIGAALVAIILVVIVIGRGKGKKMPATATAADTLATGTAAVQPTVQTLPQQPYYQVEAPEVTELRNYVSGALGQGYSPEEVRTHLIEIGWDSNTTDRIIREAQQAAQ